MTPNLEEQWKEWKENFCKHISDWSYFSADEELEKIKTILLSHSHHQKERLVERVEKMKKLDSNGRQTEPWHGYYNQAIHDIISLIEKDG